MIKKVLLVEDDRGTVLLVRAQLKSKGYTVFTAGNGLEALKILSSYTVDLIITDVVMPEMDGVDLYEAVKKDPKIANIPIIIVTDKAVFKESFASLGVSDFLEKTADVNILIEKINSIDKRVADEVKKFSKILVTGAHQIVLQKMDTVLKGVQYLVAFGQTSPEIMSKALMMVPKAIFIDVLFQDNASAHDLIRALRCFPVLANTKIITYTFFFPEELGMDVVSMQTMEEAIALCLKAGSDQYFGRFNQSFFLEKLNDMGI